MYNLTDFCCLCLGCDKNVISQISINLGAKQILEYVIPEFVFKKSEIPIQVCNNCLNIINNFFKFRQNCVVNMITFTGYVDKLMKEHGPKNYLSAAIYKISRDELIENQNNVENPEEPSFDVKIKSEIVEDEDDTNNSTENQNENDVKNVEQLLIKVEDSVDNMYEKEQATEEYILPVNDIDIEDSSSANHSIQEENSLGSAASSDVRDEKEMFPGSSASPEIGDSTKPTSLSLFPEKSSRLYENIYNTFMQWRVTNNTTSFSEDTLLVYFKELTAKYKPSSVWSHYSMLKNTLNIRHTINIDSYPKVRALLKRHAEGYRPKKSEAFSGEEVTRFINEAPDYEYLAIKVALIMGVMGACRACELYAMKMEDLNFYNGCVQVFVPQPKSKVPRNFTITGTFYDIVKKYKDLRPPDAPTQSFFLSFQNGKCKKQVIGINKFGNMGKEIAKFLGIVHPEKYTGHCLRRSSATLYFGGTAPMRVLKRHGGWKLTPVADTKKNKTDEILNQS